MVFRGPGRSVGFCDCDVTWKGELWLVYRLVEVVECWRVEWLIDWEVVELVCRHVVREVLWRGLVKQAEGVPFFLLMLKILVAVDVGFDQLIDVCVDCWSFRLNCGDNLGICGRFWSF